MATKTGLTVKDLANLEPPDGVKYELNLIEILGEYFLREHTGKIAAESLFTLSEGTARQPDVAFISNAKVRPVTSPDELIPFVPDLAIDVIETPVMPGFRSKVREFFPQ